MKANELRLGNYVNEINVGLISIELSDIEDILYGDINYTPILLTEKWLLDFGFKMYGFIDKYTQFRFKNRLIVYRDGFLRDYGTNVKLEYVHQLQNLYFALTGKELIYKK